MTVNIRCHKCGRFLGSTEGRLTAMLKCSNCGAYDRYDIIPLDSYYGASTLSPIEGRADNQNGRVIR